MPLYSKKEPYRSMLEELEEERAFTFKGSYILDADEKMGQASKELERIINKNTKGKLPPGLSKEETQREMERLSTGIIDRLRSANGKFKAFVYSKGGSRTSANEAQQTELSQKGANVEYTVMVVNGVAILEPLGQEDNATYIAEEREGLEEAITQFGRGEAIDSGIIQKVIHDRKEREGYNYGSNHILQLLDYAIDDPQRLLQVVREHNGCGLKRISQNMPTTVDAIHSQTDSRVDEMGISAEETIKAGTELERTQEIKGKETPYESV